jgi:hypothetical protein
VLTLISVYKKTEKTLLKLMNNMKNLIKFFSIIAIVGFSASCTKDFAEINNNPAMVTDPDIRHLFTSSLFDLGHSGRYTEWFYDNYNYFYRYSQATIFDGGNSGDFNRHGATGGRYGRVYEMQRNLFEIRKKIADMPAEEQALRTHVNAITFITPVMSGLQATDVHGSMPWSEAMKGRYEGNYTPKYDTQAELFQQWIDELDGAISVLLSDATNQVTYGPQDFVYNGDFAAWARLANSLKLRIAIRLEHVDQEWMRTILGEVMASPAGIIENTAQDFVWEPATDYRGEAQDFWGAPRAAHNFVSKMVELQDPRTHFFFDVNSLDQTAVDILTAQGKPLPTWIDPNVPVTRWDRYRGGPVSPDQAGKLPWFGPLTDDDNTSYQRLSHINRRFFNPFYNNGTGHWLEVMLSAAEVSFYVAEMIEKGHITGQGTAAEWYENGIRASFENYNEIARVHQVPDAESFAATASQIDSYLILEDVALNGNNDLEKIYFQQYINFFRYPTEMFALVRRTGFPSRTGDIMPWEPVMSNSVEMVLPRRFGVSEPDNPINLENWKSAMEEQGWTTGNIEGPVLNAERVWWDKESPNFGNGSW